METDPLFMLIPQENSPAYELERFITDVLYGAGVWDSYRASDGIEHWRVVERSPTLARICGRISEMSKRLYSFHSFWLDLQKNEERPEQVDWTLYFDDITISHRSPRRAAMMMEVIDAPEQIEWGVALTGTAALQDAMLIIESVRAVPIGNSPF